MIKKVVFALTAVVIVIIAIYFYNVRQEYEGIRKKSNLYTFDPLPLEKEQEDLISLARDNWRLSLQSTGSYASPLELAQYANNISGLIKFWSEEMPEYSFLDSEQNELWITRSLVHNTIFPRQLPHYYKDHTLLAVYDDLEKYPKSKKYIMIYEDVDGDIRLSIYTPKIDSDKQDAE